MAHLERAADIAIAGGVAESVSLVYGDCSPTPALQDAVETFRRPGSAFSSLDYRFFDANLGSRLWPQQTVAGHARGLRADHEPGHHGRAQRPGGTGAALPRRLVPGWSKPSNSRSNIQRTTTGRPGRHRGRRPHARCCRPTFWNASVVSTRRPSSSIATTSTCPGASGSRVGPWSTSPARASSTTRRWARAVHGSPVKPNVPFLRGGRAAVGVQIRPRRHRRRRAAVLRRERRTAIARLLSRNSGARKASGALLRRIENAHKVAAFVDGAYSRHRFAL